MKLTIGMIVKNEEERLDECLSAIKPILDSVDSELIITDTGSTDRTVEIARRYTDKVLFFEWCNDFSAARNFGLEKAQGEWFMMLDADDIFRSCDCTISFFNSGEYKKYNAATYISRNWFYAGSKDNMSYSDIFAPRLVKLIPGTRYESVVHEHLSNFLPPIFDIQDVADHYGYLYETPEDNRRKMLRNQELLLKKLDAEKDVDPMVYVQLYENMVSVKECEQKALDYLDEGMEHCRKVKSSVLVVMYFHKASFYYTADDFEKTVEVCDEYFRIDKSIRPGELYIDGEIYALKARSLFNLGRRAEACREYKSFFDTYRKIQSGKLATFDAYLYSSFLCTDLNILMLYDDFMECCVVSEKYNTADIYLSSFPIHKYSFDKSKVISLVGHIIDISGHLSYKYLKKYCAQLDDFGKKNLMERLFYKINDLDDKGTKEQLLGAISGMVKTDEKLEEKISIYNKLLSGENAFDAVSHFAGQYGVKNDVDIIYLLLQNKYDISVLMGSPDFDMSGCVYSCCRNIKGFYEAAESYSERYITENDRLEDAIKFFDCCISMKLVDNEDKSNEEKQELIRRLFEVKTGIKRRLEGNVRMSEMEKLSLAVKRNIRTFIESGNYEAAAKTLCEYEKLVPQDPDIIGFKQEIGKTGN